MPTSIELPQFVDIGVLLLVLLYAVSGWRRGFLASALGVASLLLAGWCAFTYYREVGGFIQGLLPRRDVLPDYLAWIAAFLMIAAVVSALVSWLVGWILGAAYLALRHVSLLRALDAVAGGAFGAVIGLVVAAVVVTLIAVGPLPDNLRKAVQHSAIGGQLMDRVAETAPVLDPLLSQALEDTAVFVTRPTSEAPSYDLHFPPDLQLTDDEEAARRLFDLVNEERARHGLRTLTWDDRLAAAGRQHAEEMFRLNYFAHDSPVAGSPAARARAAGARFLMLGENLAYAPTVEVAHTGLLNSPGHRANILSPAFGRLGVGVVRAGVWGRMFAQEFAE